jgi:phosphoglycerate dehydrogenase-like enzyme
LGVTILDDSWIDSLSHVDVLVNCLPLTQETTGLVSRDVLQKLPEGAMVVNVGRYETVDMDYLTRALNENKLAGAALDSLPQRKPIPSGSDLWRVRNLLVSPYVAGHYRGRQVDLESFVENQVSRWFSGEPLLNQL